MRPLGVTGKAGGVLLAGSATTGAVGAEALPLLFGERFSSSAAVSVSEP